jgi:hypothetical protein
MRPMSRGLPVLAVLVAALAMAGCGTSASEKQVRGSVDRFEKALQSQDGAAACKELSSETRSTLESDEKKPCDEAIGETDLKPVSGVKDVSVWITGGLVKLNGDTLFMDETAEGWKISAAGCKSQGSEKPYDCEVEG